MKLTDIRLFPISDENRFEDFCLDFFKIKFNDENIELNGRKGQRQNGVDIFCHINNPFEWIGIQCKVKSTGIKLKESEIVSEIEKAKLFNPKLSKYIIATTGSRDAVIQEQIRILNDKYRLQNLFNIQIVFWEDLQKELSTKEYERLIIKYYSDFIIDSSKKGFTVGRLVTIILGEIDDYSTQYELLISKIPLIDKSKTNGILYFQDRYVVCDLNSRGFSIIQPQCFPSDFETSIWGRWGQYLVSKWLRNSNIDEIINSDTDFYYCSFTKEELEDFLERESEN